MADITRRVPGCDDDCEGERGERGERGKRGRRGHRGHRGHRGQDGLAGATGPTGPAGTGNAIVTDQVNILGNGTPGDIARLSTFQPFAQVEHTIFVRPGGSDVTGDGSIGNPFATFAHALMFVPSLVPAGQFYTIDLTGLGVETLPENFQMPVIEGTFFGDQSAPHPFLFNHVLNVRAFPQLVTAIPPGDAVITAADAPVLTSDPDTQLVTLTIAVARASWAGGSLKGKQFVRTVGTSQTSCVIYDSNPTQLFLCNKIAPPGPNFIPPLAPGEQFQIVEPSATLEAPPSTDFDGGCIRCMNVSSVAFQGIRLRCTVPGGDFSIFLAGASQPFFELCDIPDGLETGDGQYQFTIFSTAFVGAFFGVDSDTFSVRRSYFASVTDFEFTPRHVDINLSVFENCPTLSTRVPAPGFVPTPHAITTWSMYDCLITGSGGDAIQALGGAWGITNTRIDNAAGNAIDAERGSNYVTLDHVTGTGNAGFGVLANDGAQVQIADNRGTTTVTGTGGDTQSGSLAPTTYAQVAAGLAYDIPNNAASAQVATGTRIFIRP